MASPSHLALTATTMRQQQPPTLHRTMRAQEEEADSGLPQAATQAQEEEEDTGLPRAAVQVLQEEQVVVAQDFQEALADTRRALLQHNDLTTFGHITPT